MEIRITGRRFNVSERTNGFVRERIEKLLRLWERTSSIEVTLDREGNGHSVEVLLSAEHKHDFVGRAVDDRLPVALDKAISKVQRQLEKYKNKIMGRRKETPAKILEAEAAARPEPEGEEQGSEELEDASPADQDEDDSAANP